MDRAAKGEVSGYVWYGCKVGVTAAVCSDSLGNLESRLTEQRDNEHRAREAGPQADVQTWPGKRRRLEESMDYVERNAVMAGPSSGGQGGRGADISTRSRGYYPSIAEVLAGSSTGIQEGRGVEERK